MDRGDAPAEWCGQVSRRMNKKEKACDSYDPQKRAETMEDSAHSVQLKSTCLEKSDQISRVDGFEQMRGGGVH